MSQQTQSIPSVRARLPTTRFMTAVLGGDLLVLFAFVATGQYTHGYFFWEFPVRTLMVLLPFAIGWLLVAPLAGLFSPERIRSFRLTVPLVAGAWIVAASVGAFLRSTPYFPGGASIEFLLVNIGFGILYFVPWRLLVSWRLK